MSHKIHPSIFYATVLLLLVLLQSTASAQTLSNPVSIALQTMAGGERLGILLTIGGSPNAGYYILDTGSSPLTSAYDTNATWWGAFTSDTNTTYVIKYGGGSGGSKLDYHPADAVITIGSGIGSVSTPSTDSLAQVIARYTNANTNKNQPADWQKDTSFTNQIASSTTPANGPFPGGFFGTLGSDLSDSSKGLYSIVNSLQYGSGISKGFILNGTSNAPTLTIGINAPTSASFTNLYAMNMNAGQIDQDPLTMNYRISLGAMTITNALPTLLDSGTPPSTGVFITQGSAVDVSAFTTTNNSIVTLKDGTTITALIGDTPYTLTSTSNNPISVFDSPTNSAHGGITIGMNFFQNYQVMYDLNSNQVGIMAVPEPDSIALVLCGLGMILILPRVIRQRY